ncbi:MAG: sugar transferase [Desulfomonile tiedjei]|uniref:Sugar transferase n=1 Tax=Desulfomonile tiedjei TaxID=2358 RepID=A0A9D6UXU5_9BACT|nr:sugar transferase [Desulfomonile tiedjei]
MHLKRLIDVVVGSVGIALAAPIMLIIVAMLKLESSGAIIYRCKRIGRFGREFDMLKFRTMIENADNVDCKLCVGTDVRVTSLGSFLRRTKLNELPQLFNVVKGDMSLVGPRPEDPKFMKYYTDKWDVVLQARPGIMGANQILHRNEEDLFPPDQDPEKFYVENILPEKLERDVEYVLNSNLWRDMALLVRGVYVSIFRGEMLSRVSSNLQFFWRALLDTGLSIAAYVAACFIRLETTDLSYDLLMNLLIIVVANPIVFAATGLYRRSARFYSLPDLFLVAKISALAGFVLIIANAFLIPREFHSRTVFFLYPLILLGLLSGARVLHQLTLERLERKPLEGHSAQNALIYGAGRLGAETVKRLQFEPGINVAGFVDDDPSLRNQSVLGIRVLGSGNDLAFLRALYEIEKVFIAFTPHDSKALKKVRQLCAESGLTDILIRSAIPEKPGKMLAARRYFRGVRFSDVLGMNEVELEKNRLLPLVEGAAVAVMGAGDEFGEQICRELLHLKISRLVVVEECPSRLNRISEVLNSIHSPRTAYYPYFHPFGMHELTEQAMRQHDVRWVIYNRINRPLVDPLPNLPGLTSSSFVELVRHVETAKRLQCDYFTFVSPYMKDCFSHHEKSLHLMAENYITVSAVETDTRFGIVRVQNVIENENELFRSTCERIIHDRPISIPGHEMKFSSARYAARIVLNSLPLHYLGETFVEGAGLSIALRNLLDSYFEMQGNEKCRSLLRSYVWTGGIQNDTNKTVFESDYLRTVIPNVWALNEPELAGLNGNEKLIDEVSRYLNTDEKIAVRKFLSALRKGVDIDIPMSGEQVQLTAYQI